jgi:hypothetical protein
MTKAKVKAPAVEATIPAATAEATPVTPEAPKKAAPAKEKKETPAVDYIGKALQVVSNVKLELECCTVTVPATGSRSGVIGQCVTTVNPRAMRAFEYLDDAEALLYTCAGAPKKAKATKPLAVEVQNHDEETITVAVEELPVPMRLKKLSEVLTELVSATPYKQLGGLRLHRLIIGNVVHASALLRTL